MLMKKMHFLLSLAFFTSTAQIQLPYTANFNSGEEGWSHYAIAGDDNWEHGLASGTTNVDNLSWATMLNGSPSANSNMALESPSFDMTNASLPYVLSFKNDSDINGGNLYLEYTLDNGATWLLLNPTTVLKKNWQAAGGFALDTYESANISAINISFLQGNNNVKFRFRFVTSFFTSGFGWKVDDFSIAPEYYNISASGGNEIEISPLCPEFTVKSTINFNNQYSQYYTIATKYYLSVDTILDDSDTLIGEKEADINMDNGYWDKTFTTIPNLVPGQYYILFRHDSNDAVAEGNENDNIAYSSFLVKNIFPVPYATDFESNDINWKSSQSPYSIEEMLWSRGAGTRHHIEKAHSGISAWHTSKTTIEHPDYTFQWVESPYFNMNTVSGDKYINFWFKDDYPGGVGYYDNEYKVQYSLDCNDYWVDLTVIPQNLTDEWEFLNILLPENVSNNANVKFRITYQGTYLKPEGIIFDDFYIGTQAADLSVEKIYSNNHFTSSSSGLDVLKYEVHNSGISEIANATTNFYWSQDAILDSGDVLLGTQAITGFTGASVQWMEFSYTKPTTAIGDYFIIYKLDANNVISELRENNNIGAIPIEQLATATFPYYNDFEEQTLNWKHEATLGADHWQFGMPLGTIIDSTFSETKAWISSLIGVTASMGREHLYTPAFNLSNSVNPVLEFDMKYDSWGNCSCDVMTLNLSYSIDNGATWKVLNPVNNSYSKWSHTMKYDSGTDADDTINQTKKMFAETEEVLTSYTQYNSRDISRNTKYIINIPQLKDETNIRFRYNFSTLYDENTLIQGTPEGAVIDNFAIKEAVIDLGVSYTKNMLLSSQSEKVNFSIDVKNSGNYISNPTIIKFYLSEDPVFSTGDYLLGTANVQAIRPDFKSYLSLEYSLPANFTTYNYLVYVIDDANLNVESNETNNTGFYTLGLQGITTFPYAENFEGDIINGWYGYSYVNYSTTDLANYRVTNKIPITSKNNTYTKTYNGILGTEAVPYGSWQSYNTPTFYIQSPAFDFTAYSDQEPLTVAFDYLCIGAYGQSGGNMQYSTDGGVNWVILTTANGASVNWYPSNQTMSQVNNEPGWNGYTGEIKTAKMDISFLQNESNVLFRYKYHSNYASSEQAPSGFRLDNFVIGGETIANNISCLESIPYNMTFDNFENNCWEAGTNADETILYEKSATPNIEWKAANNFAATINNASAKIDLVGQGNSNGVWFISPKFEMVPDNKLKFNIALTAEGNLNAASLDSDDQIKLMYSQNNGLTWETLKTWNTYSEISNTGQLELQDFLPETGNVRFAFWATNGLVNNSSNTTFYVDNFKLYTDNLGIGSIEDLLLNYAPNPVTDKLSITSKEIILQVVITNSLGQKVSELDPKQMECSLDFVKLPSGVYFVTVYGNNSKVKTFKIIKR